MPPGENTKNHSLPHAHPLSMTLPSTQTQRTAQLKRHTRTHTRGGHLRTGHASSVSYKHVYTHIRARITFTLPQRHSQPQPRPSLFTHLDTQWPTNSRTHRCIKQPHEMRCSICRRPHERTCIHVAARTVTNCDTHTTRNLA